MCGFLFQLEIKKSSCFAPNKAGITEKLLIDPKDQSAVKQLENVFFTKLFKKKPPTKVWVITLKHKL